MQRSNVYTSYNLFFIIPFILWIIAGGLLQYYLDQPTLFIYINARYNSNLDGFMSLVTNMGESIFIIPAAMLLFIRKEYRNWSYVFAAVTANIGAFFLSQALKSYFDYPRPLNFFGKPSGFILCRNGNNISIAAFLQGIPQELLHCFAFYLCS